jgi:hypothetical protein
VAEESQDGQEKTEDPSQRKIDKSKEDGQILQSKEMFVFTSIAMGMLIFLFIPEFAVPGMKEWGKLFQIESKEQLSSLYPFISGVPDYHHHCIIYWHSIDDSKLVNTISRWRNKFCAKSCCI